MRKMLLVMLYELWATITRPSFLFTAMGVPLIVGLVFLGFSKLNQSAPDAIPAVLSPEQGQPSRQVHGYVDQAGIINMLPEGVSEESLLSFPDEESANLALAQGEIYSYSIITRDYLETGKVILVQPDFNPFETFSGSHMMQWVVDYNLLGGSVELTEKYFNPFQIEIMRQETSEPVDQQAAESPLAFFIPYIVMMLFYMVILFAASLLLNSVTREKENRVIEILMSAVTPLQLLGGKIIGLGIAGLVQTGLWLGTAYSLLIMSGDTFKIPEALIPDASILVWGVVFFLLGYIMYASFMAAVGALVPNLKEASQATIIVILPILVSLMFVNVIVEEPNGGIATGFSLFPLTSPVIMMTRLAATRVPVWHLVLSVVLLLATVVLIVRMVAGMFRAQTLLSGQAFNLKRLFNALAGRV